MKTLTVWYRDRSVGTLHEQDDGGLVFTYDPSWLEDAEAFALGRTLPLEGRIDPVLAARFFGNLLPEGIVRSAVCRRLGISEDNDVALLGAIGRDCAGAIAVLSPGERPDEKGALEPLGAQRLEGYLRQPPALASALGDVRFSLAGAQDKLGVAFDGKRLFLPSGSAPSTHLLKLPNRDFAGLPENEGLIMRLAAAIGLPTSPTRFWLGPSRPLLVVARYDRIVGADGVDRLHQEDFSQALGFDRRHKYENDGGPSLADCVSVIRERSGQALVDTRSLLEWGVFSLVVGNRDNHSKNLALLRGLDGRWRLAPFYDLVCTTVYPRLSRRLALSIGGKWDGGNLSRSAWAEEAARIDVGKAYLLDLAEGVAERLRGTLPAAYDAVASELGSRASLDAVRRVIQKGLRTVTRSLGH